MSSGGSWCLLPVAYGGRWRLSMVDGVCVIGGGSLS